MSAGRLSTIISDIDCIIKKLTDSEAKVQQDQFFDTKPSSDLKRKLDLLRAKIIVLPESQQQSYSEIVVTIKGAFELIPEASNTVYSYQRNIKSDTDVVSKVKAQRNQLNVINAKLLSYSENKSKLVREIASDLIKVLAYCVVVGLFGVAVSCGPIAALCVIGSLLHMMAMPVAVGLFAAAGKGALIAGLTVATDLALSRRRYGFFHSDKNIVDAVRNVGDSLVTLANKRC